ncbi:hypothetical protein B0W47_16565 (plasmid) [Komagataeibacter nataicola]|uniref:Uncharacterized protein n=1 Tax=Komagataeibacter nataicola TaxID=265960 RepID=A0A9N7CK08_9PROT|nr:PcfJ domain-containing protein [Komagataeibacter nataicola]AQU89195.1 hypothetical protein B0W47_16565 [Komagataeibacter nataicola]PYD66291.1 hypothetical protein CDI09_09085 [Komagataeibacter nataicola]WNM10329.1 PcfJ domain-containing protein [Komagataeibacter nataicola]GBR23605.1 hypothetical protein AA0616_2564 [Komagataeibacter nataicola NRIC 0616]
MTDEEKQRKIAEENRKLTDIQEQANLYAGKCPEFAKEWMKKRLESYAKKNDYNLPPEDEITNTRDWLHGLQEEDPKLANKIDRISWEAGQGHQEKWHDKLAKKAEKLSEFRGNPDDITPMIKYEDGFQWVKLDTPEAKDFEGNAMGNCVGKGGYDNKTIFSLRDKDNFPHVTIEYDEKTKTIQQMKCKGNSEVTDDYMPVVKNLMMELKPEHIYDIDNAVSKDGDYYIGIYEIKQAVNDGIKFDAINIEGEYALSKEGEFYTNFIDIYDAMKEGVKFDDVQLDSLYEQQNYALSNDGILCVENDIYDTKDKGLKFDKGKISVSGEYTMSKDGTLYVGVNEIKQAVENGVKFETIDMRTAIMYAYAEDGSLYLGQNAIKNIPEDVVLKEVDITGSKNITEFNNKVEGRFIAPFSGLEKIGPNAEFGDEVDIRGCKNLTGFNNKVEGFFYADDSGLEKIGPNAEFGGNVDVSKCKNLTEFNHKVPGRFFAYSSGLTTIGPNTEFGGSVDIEGCKNITEFNHKVEGNFDAENSSLTNIGPNAEFGRNVDISGTPLSEEIGMDVIKTPEEKQAFADAIKSMDSKQEQIPEHIPEPEEEHSMSM